MLIEKGKVTRGAIGLIPIDLKPFQKKDMNIDGGAVVYSLDNDTPAAKAGIKKDDVIVRVGNVPIKNQLDVRMAMYHIAPGSKVDVEVIRGGQHKTIGVNVVDSEDLMKELDKKNPRPQQQQQFNGGNDGGQSDPFQEFPDIKRLFPNQRGGNDNGDDKQPSQPHTGPARLGVGISDISDAARSQFDIPANVTGAVVGSVEKGSSADIIGIEPGMVIQELNGKTIRSAADIKEAMKNVKWGDTVHIKYGRYAKGATMQSEQDVKIR
jgi:serine protease Do